MHSVVGILVRLSCALLLAVFIGGCASKPNGPEVLTISAADYPAAFDAAVEAARRQGLPALLRDRRGGVIETDDRMAGSILEPWRNDNASFDQALENTIAFQRRRARFEFAPVGFNPQEGAAAAAPTTRPLTGPDVVNAEGQPIDLTQATGDVELRVWVYVERGSMPGMRRSTWTRSKTTQTQLVYPEGQTDKPKAKDRDKGIGVIWSPVARDPDYERRLLGMVQQMLTSGEFPTTKPEPVLANGE